MKKFIHLFTLFVVLCVPVCLGDSNLDGFVLIKGGVFNRGRGANQTGALVRVEDFEILDHPVTNSEYEAFVKDTSYPAPLHWDDGRIPAGKRDYPVIFVNRSDVNAYLRWLTQKEGRMYRLPTSVEFEYAARGGLKNQTYPWGNDSPQDKANYDLNRDRRFDRWKDYLKPARWGHRNKYGLYGTAGNVWQMTADCHEPATTRFRYRIEDPSLIEKAVMGGSWARSGEYLKCGYRLSISAGIRHGDLGFRPVREPEHSDWAIQNRNLCAIPLGDDKILLSWSLLRQDTPSTRFVVYRARTRDHAGFPATKEPVAQSTTFVDSGLIPGRRYQYYVRPIDRSGRQGRRSEWIGVTAAPEHSSTVVELKPLFKQGSLVPIFGDLDGDGTLDCVIRLDNGNREMSQDPGIPIQLEAFTSYGRSLWRKDICYHDHCYGSANNVPFNVWDMDGDGKAEVITRLQIGDSVYVAILNGMTGKVKYKSPWPEMVSDFARSSTRIHMSVAYLDGKRPAVVTQTGLYENEVFVAFDAQLRQLWRFESFAETSGSGGHKIEVADVDGDGKQEVFDGTTCLNHDGTLRWSIYRQHPDIVSIHDYLGERPGLEVFYIVESSMHAGVYMVDANSGQIIWKVNREDDPRWTHGHAGWTADIWQASPGMECVSNRAGHGDRNLVLFAADGRVLSEPFPYGYIPLEWDGDLARELLSGQNHKIGNFNGKEVVFTREVQPDLPKISQVLMVADLYGDFRDELVLSVTGEDQKRFIAVVTATHPTDRRYVAATEKKNYRLWLARNMGGGYRSIYDRPLIKPQSD
ncbi:MAG: SUMF1/EgtB/PvdO family nonheme iron enzyme [Phycisphaerales bacterium]|nr:MAG: SUMF1/EgtB/PvdO family nonheme iron enzyme [Phycisphaerales bacterium]